MNLESLQIFRSVVDSGGFSRAVSHCKRTQSAISKQVRALEAELGTQLLERGKRGIHLTNAGRILYERSETILREIDAARNLVQGSAHERPTNLSVGTTFSIGISYFPGFFKNFTRRNPQCHLDIQVDYTSALLRAVEQREIDCAVVCLPKRLPSNLVCLKRFDDSMTLVASHAWLKRSGHRAMLQDPNARDDQAVRHALAALREEPLILIGSRNYTRRLIDRFLAEHDMPSDAAMELDSFDLIVSFVSLDLGYSIVPSRVLPVYSRSRAMACERVAQLPLKRQLGIVTHRDRVALPAVEEFVRFFAY